MKIVCVIENLSEYEIQMPIFLDLDQLSTGCKEARKYARVIGKALKNNKEAFVDSELMLCWGNWEYESYTKDFPCIVEAQIDVYPKDE